MGAEVIDPGAFNSATAFEPWRPGWARRSGTRGGAFNSATAFEPWRRSGSGWRPAAARPSIRPRLLSRGDRSIPAARRPSPVPFNSATAFEPWRQRSRRPTGRRRGAFNSATAFEPWRPAGWCVRACATRAFNSATAFEPWRRRRGHGDRDRRKPLQFGHGF